MIFVKYPDICTLFAKMACLRGAFRAGKSKYNV